MGATVVVGGTTFRVWAPDALEVYVVLHDFDVAATGGWSKNPGDLLIKSLEGHWTGFFANIAAGAEYRYWIVGTGGEGFKRDPYARELAMIGWPDNNCLVCVPNTYPWHDQNYQPSHQAELIIYQLHIGVFYARDAAGNDLRSQRVSKYLDVADRIPYLADLGVTAIMPLPFAEFPGENSLGYNGTDMFSPEMDYAVSGADLPIYLAKVNTLLANKGCPALTSAQLAGQSNQLKALIDLCHLYGMNVIADVVYNHAGPGFDAQSMRYFNFPADLSFDRYFVEVDHAGGRVFRFADPNVQQFLIDNGKMWLTDYHVDGLRYDQVTVIDQNGGWFFCQNLTSTLRFIKPSCVQIAEYWGDIRWLGVGAPPAGLGFDVGYEDRLRKAIRTVIGQATGGQSAAISWDGVRDALYSQWNYPSPSQCLQGVENHDLEYFPHTGDDRQPRMPVLGDAADSRSWYARSRARVATGLILTAVGVPMLFMGQEFLEDKYWDDYFKRPFTLIWWDGLEGADPHSANHHRFTRDLIALRRAQPALRSDGLQVTYINNDDRIIVFQRWVPGTGRDVIIVVSLNETTFYNRSYQIGFPTRGQWNEVFNSDIYDNWFNPQAQGNYGGVTADGSPLHGLSTSAGITIPANSLLVFAQS